MMFVSGALQKQYACHQNIHIPSFIIWLNHARLPNVSAVFFRSCPWLSTSGEHLFSEVLRL